MDLYLWNSHLTMKEVQETVAYQILENKAELSPSDRALLERAESQRALAYAPYSHFHVGSALRLADGTIIVGSNQENASFPVGICGERVALFAAGAQYPYQPVDTIAISVASEEEDLAPAAAPCGMCRQAIAEYEVRHQRPIRLILGGETSTIYIMESASQLLPLAFDASFLQRKKD